MNLFPIDPVNSPPSPREFRKTVKNLFESYHARDVDFLQEIVQNAVDAVEDKRNTTSVDSSYIPKIILDIDSARGVITISDNGIGIPDEQIARLAAPSNTNKDSRRKRGYKGVGLTYVVWQSLTFRFATKRAKDEHVISGKLEGGHDWIISDSDDHNPTIQLDNFDPQFLHGKTTGTVMEFTLGESHDLFKLLKRLTDGGLQTLLRTRTAIGFVEVDNIRDQEYPQWTKRIKVELKREGSEPIIIPMKYLYPHEFFGQKSLDLESTHDLSLGQQERIKGTKECIWTTLNTREIASFFDPGSDYSQIIKDQHIRAYGAFVDEKKSFDRWNDSYFVSNYGPGRKPRLVPNGLNFSSNTMPTAEGLNIYLKYGTGNANRLFVILQMDSVPTDLGRKTLEQIMVEIGQEVASRFSTEKLVPNREFLIQHEIPHGPTESDQVSERASTINMAGNKRDLALQNLGLVKEPTGEQDVVGLFMALVAKGKLKGYRIYSLLGSHSKYDCVFAYDLSKEEGMSDTDNLALPEGSFGRTGNVHFNPEILEFKYSLSMLTEDFDSDYKNFNDIRLVVAWEKGDEELLGERSDYYLTEIDNDSRDKQFYGETHLLTKTSDGNKIHVMILKEVIESLVSQITGNA